MTAPLSDIPSYVGRFAPSPTGPLHFGSLVAALASYLDARACRGHWLLRMEDLDPPREMPGASDAILASLDAHGLHWDGPTMFQSQRSGAYRQALTELDAEGLLFACSCTRRQIAAAGGVYPGICRKSASPGGALAALADSDKALALRLKTHDLPPAYAGMETPIRFDDLLAGPQDCELAREVGDFVVLRKDALFAYQLAVVVDDIAQGVSHVIRGADLLSSTPQQIFLFRLFGRPEPRYGHIPLAVDASGQKLSKQQGAAALDDRQASVNLQQAFDFLGHPLPAELRAAPCPEQLVWGAAHWQRTRVPGTATRD